MATVASKSTDATTALLRTLPPGPHRFETGRANDAREAVPEVESVPLACTINFRKWHIGLVGFFADAVIVAGHKSIIRVAVAAAPGLQDGRAAVMVAAA